LCRESELPPPYEGNAGPLLSDVVIKKSYLSVLRDPSTSNWERHFYSLRRPYLYIYASSNETDIQNVINVETVRVETSKEILDLAGKKNVFALYTPQVRPSVLFEQR
jgi:kinesin family protein 1